MRETIQQKLDELTNIEISTEVPDDMLENSTTYFSFTFADNFVNSDMERDFKIIANTFYKNVPEAMDFNNYNYFTDTTAIDTYMLKSFTEFTLSQIYSMAYNGNEYALKLLVYLYKTYYKKEYKIQLGQ